MPIFCKPTGRQVLRRSRRVHCCKTGNATGFTLIELMVVIVILGILAAIIAPKIVGRTDEAKVTEARVQISNLETALKMYKLDNGFYPTTDQGLIALVSSPSTEPRPRRWKKGGYLEKNAIPKDPWANAYVYVSPGLNGDYDIVSYGADALRGGREFDADISNWDVE